MAFGGVQRLREEEVAPPAPLSLLQPPPAPARFPFLDHLLGCMIAAGQGVQSLCLFLHLSREALFAHLIRLGIATPHDRPMRSGGPKAWLVADTVLAIFLRLAGVHPDVIGQRHAVGIDADQDVSLLRAQQRRRLHADLTACANALDQR